MGDISDPAPADSEVAHAAGPTHHDHRAEWQHGRLVGDRDVDGVRRALRRLPPEYRAYAAAVLVGLLFLAAAALQALAATHQAR